MQVIVTINTCRDCRYLDDSGGFTIGGPIPVCDHHGAMSRKITQPKDSAVSVFLRAGISSVVAYKYIAAFGKEEGRDILSGHHWVHRVPFVDWNKPCLPDWCPLKNGGGY